MRTLPVALTIAGSDSGGGAGIQADLHTFARLGCWGTSAITCVTAQNPAAVTRVAGVAPEMVAEQIRAVATRFPLRAVKIGMTYSGRIVDAIADALSRHASGVPVVVDPIMRATSGASLLLRDGEAALVRRLLPLATIVTPNLLEAQKLSGMAAVRDLAAMEEAARRIQAKTPGAVLVKGGHLEGAATDVLCIEGRIIPLAGERVKAPFTHGTGCALSAAIAASLAQGHGLVEAVREAKAYVGELLRDGVQLGDEGLGGLGLTMEKADPTPATNAPPRGDRPR
jgi:hydroxymethylpyrimidine/phosphomethylpyrimidine kinase